MQPRQNENDPPNTLCTNLSERLNILSLVDDQGHAQTVQSQNLSELIRGTHTYPGLISADEWKLTKMPTKKTHAAAMAEKAEEAKTVQADPSLKQEPALSGTAAIQCKTFENRLFLVESATPSRPSLSELKVTKTLRKSGKMQSAPVGK